MGLGTVYLLCFAGVVLFFISGDRGVHHPNNSLIDNLDSSRSHAPSSALQGKEAALSSAVTVTARVEVGLDSVSDFVVVLVVASQVQEGAAVGKNGSRAEVLSQ